MFGLGLTCLKCNVCNVWVWNVWVGNVRVWNVRVWNVRVWNVWVIGCLECLGRVIECCICLDWNVWVRNV